MAVYEPCDRYPRFNGIKPSGLQEEYRNDSSLYNHTGAYKSYFIINQQWLSEKLEAPPTPLRGHRPWPFEFPGARTAFRPPSAVSKASEIIEDDEYQYEKPKVNITTSPSVLPLWGSLNSSPRSWTNPAKYSYQLDSSRFENGAPKAQPSRYPIDEVCLNPKDTRSMQPAPIITYQPRYKDGPRPPTPPKFGRINTTMF